MSNKVFDPNIYEEIKGVKFCSGALALISLILIFIDRLIFKNLISFVFLLEISLICFLYFSYLKSINKRNFMFWGLSFVISIFLLRNLLYYSFYNFHQSALILTLVGSVFLSVICYIMSSPLYYSRVQWWEYDYKYRADLRVSVEFDESIVDGRLTDLRRSEASVELFDYYPPETTAKLIVGLGEEKIYLDIKIKTSKEVIRGRPLEYGVVFDKKHDNFLTIKNFWNKNKKAKFRNRFIKDV